MKFLDKLFGRNEKQEAEEENIVRDHAKLDRALDLMLEVTEKSKVISTELDMAVKELVGEFRSKKGTRHAKTVARTNKT